MLWVRAQSPWGHHRDVRFYSYWGRKPQEGFKKRGDKIWFVMLKNDCSSCFAELQTVELLGSKVTADGDCSHEIKRRLLLGRKVMTNLDKHIKKQRHYFANKGPSSQGYGFFSSHVWMWELDCEESWVLKNWCFWTVVLEKIREFQG